MEWNGMEWTEMEWMEGNSNTHKNVRNRSYGFEIYLVNVKTMRMIFSNLECFSEIPNFIGQSLEIPP